MGFSPEEKEMHAKLKLCKNKEEANQVYADTMLGNQQMLIESVYGH